MTLFLKKPRPQTDFYLSLLNCVYFYFSFFVVIFGFSNLSLFGIVECFCTICFFTHFLHTKKASILSELTLFYLYIFFHFGFFFQQVLHAFQADVQG